MKKFVKLNIYAALNILNISFKVKKMINSSKFRFFYINFGHFIDHMFMLIFAKAAFNAGIEFGIAKLMINYFS